MHTRVGLGFWAMSEVPELLERLLRTPSPSGYEAAAAAVWREAASFGEVETDPRPQLR